MTNDLFTTSVILIRFYANHYFDCLSRNYIPVGKNFIVFFTFTLEDISLITVKSSTSYGHGHAVLLIHDA